MINLLSYERRLNLKSLYRERLIIVAFLVVAVALVPFILAVWALSYTEYSNIRALTVQEKNTTELRRAQGLEDLFNNVREANRIIGTMQGSLKESRPISSDIENILRFRGTDISITGFEFSKTEKTKEQIISIKGMAKSRDAVINFGAALSDPIDGICKKINLPLTTYTKKVDIPFTLTCDTKHERN